MIDRDTAGRRITGWATLVAGLGALAGGLATLTAPSVAPDAGTVPAAAVTTPVAPRVSSGVTREPVAAAFSPTGVTIAALRVSAPVDPVGVTAGGELSIPDDPARLGWWIGSAGPGSPRGTVLLAGHVDTAADGRGALFELEKLRMGALIGVRAGATVVTYRAVARRSYGKSRLPADLFDADTAARLVLVTCGGEFRDGSYNDNVVLYAVPVK
jgi:sortase family protein